MWRDCWIVLLSRPARALWIEIEAAKAFWQAEHVEAREVLVDCNLPKIALSLTPLPIQPLHRTL